MSTKCTLAHGETFHFYREALDYDHVYLQLESTEYEAGHGRITIQVPIHIWETVRHLGGSSLDLVEKTDADLLEKVTADVDRRIEDFRTVLREQPGHSSWARLSGVLVYGAPDEPRELQIETALEYYQLERQRQTNLKAAIVALEPRKQPRG